MCKTSSFHLFWQNVCLITFLITCNHRRKMKTLKNNASTPFSRLFTTGDERIELPPQVLETPLIPFDQSPVWGLAIRKSLIYYTVYKCICQEIFFLFLSTNSNQILTVQLCTRTNAAWPNCCGPLKGHISRRAHIPARALLPLSR